MEEIGNCKNKEKSYMSETQELARFAKALAHPARIKIMKYLSQAKSCFTGEFVDVLPLAQSTVSQHVKELKDAGLILASENPHKMSYCISQDNWAKAKLLFEGFFDINFEFSNSDEQNYKH